MAIKLKRFSKKSKLFGYDDYDPSKAVWGWMLHFINDDGKEYIFYTEDCEGSKEDAKDSLDEFISMDTDDKAKVLHKKVIKCDGTDFVSEWKKKYPKAKVEGV